MGVLRLISIALKTWIGIWVVLIVVGLLLLGTEEAARVQHVPAQVAIEQREQQERQTQAFAEEQRQAAH
jgi:hypothetical protein